MGVTFYEVTSERIPDSFDYYRIVQLSDLHDAEFGDNHRELVKRVKMLTPSVIFITGDFIDSNRYDLERSLTLIEELQFVAPFYFVTGNHEIATNDEKHIKEELEKLGVRVLSNESLYVTGNEGDLIAVGGIEDPLAHGTDDATTVGMSIEKTFQDVPESVYKILLSHRPEQFEQYVKADVDLTFSGHAHGGQIRIPGIGGLLSPGQGWFPRYTSGIHEQDGSLMVISRGLGNSIVPLRLFNQPEIVVVTLRTV
ncbi:metallophosphoesterase [Sporosarcina sp. 179-K 3D1 HS]|uniref:metallophosphoesterase n=1 Tax=Sporosarcina sp. 179-K 3D1 HS TaxID=3232169 RepID=UPI00399FD3DB